MASDQNEKRGRTVILPASSWETIKAIADSDRRTINAQIEVLIDQENSRRQWNDAVARNREASEA